jgi:hypothetical protein
VSRFSRSLLLSGWGGLLACGLAVAVSVWLVESAILAPPLPHPLISLLLIIILGGFSLAEIPLMVIALRRLAAERSDNLGFIWGLNGLYVFFAAVYGVPVLLITGNVSWGLALCGLSVVRFATSLLIVRETRQ